METLTKEDIFCKEVDSSGFAFHSRYIDPSIKWFSKEMETLKIEKKERSPKWISSSVPANLWSTPEGKMHSYMYQVNNVRNPVLFEEGMEYIPKNAICIEISPHGLFQSILKNTIGSDATVLSLMKRNHKDNLLYLLENLGR